MRHLGHIEAQAAGSHGAAKQFHMNDNDRALCVLTAGLLRAGSAIAMWGLAISCIAALVLALTGRSLPPPAWLAFASVALVGLPERFLALRLRFDAALYEGLLQGTIVSVPALGAALERMGWRQATSTAPTMDARFFATQRTMRRHGMLVAAQTVLFALALALQDAR